MPTISELYPSKYLTAADLNESDATLKISSMDMEKMQDGGEKLIVFFEDHPKGLVCNKTNAKTIATMYGQDTDEWIGERVTLFPTQVDYQGKMVDAIRIRPRVPRTPKVAAPAAKAAVPAGKPSRRPEPPPADDDDTDDSTDEMDGPPF